MTKLKITLDVKSGLPNPTWILSEEKSKEFLEISGWNELIYQDNLGETLPLGYKGCVVEAISEQTGKADTSTSKSGNVIKGKEYHLPDSFRIYGSGNMTDAKNVLRPSISIEDIREKEKWLVNTYKDITDTSEEMKTDLKKFDANDELKEYIMQAIDKGNNSFTKSNEYKQDMSYFEDKTKASCNTIGASYNLPFWNHPFHIRLNNCYNYAMNNRTDTFAQPGRAHNCTFDISCSSVSNAAKCDSVVANCTSNNPYYVIALVIWPGQDYHWYHLHSQNFWGHKPGQTAARNWDNSNNIIDQSLGIFPHNCDRGPYTSFCGYYYGPENALIG